MRLSPHFKCLRITENISFSLSFSTSNNAWARSLAPIHHFLPTSSTLCAQNIGLPLITRHVQWILPFVEKAQRLFFFFKNSTSVKGWLCTFMLRASTSHCGDVSTSRNKTNATWPYPYASSGMECLLHLKRILAALWRNRMWKNTTTCTFGISQVMLQHENTLFCFWHYAPV